MLLINQVTLYNSNCFWVSINVSGAIIFLLNFQNLYNFWVRLLMSFLNLVCKQMTQNYFKSRLIYPKKKSQCKGHQIYYKLLRKICSKETLISILSRVIKNSSLDQSFVYTCFKPLRAISRSCSECFLVSTASLSCT